LEVCALLAESSKAMIVVTVSAVAYLGLILLASALLWKNVNRLMDSRALKDYIQKSVNVARISGKGIKPAQTVDKNLSTRTKGILS
jgi:hypothetical protein